MTVVVSFMKPSGVGSVNSPGVGKVRIRENITVPGTTSASLQDGEVAYVANGEADMVAVALGTAPDAAATASTAATNAGTGLGSGLGLAFVGAVGDKVNVKALA